MAQNNFLKELLTDVKVEVSGEFDRNFERKGFFNKRWPNTKHHNSRGSLMQRSGKLRRGIKSQLKGNGIHFSNSMPYADIHNNGGTIQVTAKMRRFFWAMYYKSSGAVTYSVKTRKAANTQRNQNLSAEAEKWKAMALLPIGTKIKIEQRQFIGHHQSIDKIIESNADHHIGEVARKLGNNLKQR